MSTERDKEEPASVPATPPETTSFPDPTGPVEIPVLSPDYVNEGLDPDKLGIIIKNS